jgi:hypothetical protein
MSRLATQASTRSQFNVEAQSGIHGIEVDGRTFLMLARATEISP